MKRVISSNKSIVDILVKTIELLKKNDAFICDDIYIKEHKGQLSVHSSIVANPQAKSKTLISLPKKLLIPVEWFTLENYNNKIKIKFCSSQANDTQIKLLELMIALYNATDKLNWFSRLSLKHNLPKSHPVMQKILMAHGFKQKHRLNPPEADLLDSFISTRALGVKSKSGAKNQVLMPLIDLINHNAQGAAFAGNKTAGITVNKAQIDGKSECFANYGFKDALAMLLNYNYLDYKIPFLYCIPISYSVSEVGPINIGRHIDLKKHKTRHRLLKQIPKNINFSGKAMYCSGVLISTDKNYDNLYLTLSIMIKKLAFHLGRPKVKETVIKKAELDILGECLSYYQQLGQMTDTENNDIANKNIMGLVRKLAVLQSKIIVQRINLARDR